MRGQSKRSLVLRFLASNQLTLDRKQPSVNKGTSVSALFAGVGLRLGCCRGRPALLLPPHPSIGCVSSILMGTVLPSLGRSWDGYAGALLGGLCPCPCCPAGACIPTLLPSPPPLAAPPLQRSSLDPVSSPRTGLPCHLLWGKVLCVAIASLLETCLRYPHRDCGRPASPLLGLLLSRSCGCLLGRLCFSHGLLHVRYHGTSPA